MTCNERSIGVLVPMRSAYTGRIYVSGQSSDPNCIRRYSGQSDSVKSPFHCLFVNNKTLFQAYFEIPIGQCDMTVERVVKDALFNNTNQSGYFTDKPSIRHGVSCAGHRQFSH